MSLLQHTSWQYVQLPKGSGSPHKVKLWNAWTEAESTQGFNQELNGLMGDEGHSYWPWLGTGQTQPPTAQVLCSPHSEFLRQKISSIFWGEQQQEAGIPLPPFPVLLRRTAGGTGSTNPPCHTQVLSPSHCFCLAAVSKDHTSPCEAQEASDPHSWSCGWCHILTGRDLLQNSCRTWLCCQARKPQEVFEDESPESVFLDSRPNPVI